MKISIIVPVLNEAKNLPRIFQQLQLFRELNHEVIVVDGGSVDNSLALSYKGADVVLSSVPGRAVQMNNGAAVASGDVFLFLHADTVLPRDAAVLITSIKNDSFWGFFSVRLSGHKAVFRLIEWLINHRSGFSSIATGDQAIFIERNFFNNIGGFPEIMLMEDIAVSRLLKNITVPVRLASKVITSSRRWEQNGVVATVLLMWKLRLLYFFGVSPEKLCRMYR